MYFQQIVRQDIGCAAYIVGSTDSGEAAVIDPRIDMVDEILEIAAREGMVIRYIIETHNHADHVSGHHLLAERTGARIAVYKDAGVEFDHLPLDDGQELQLGEVRLRAIHTPGHRPEHLVLAVIDTSRSDDPWLVLTGDTLFIGDVARPDLAVDGQEGARALFTSLHTRLLGLPEGTMVYPGHVSGSLCGRVTNRMTGTTIGFEKRFNPALSIEREAAFVRYMNESLPERPPNMARIVELNRAAQSVQIQPPTPLSPEDVAQQLEAGALVLDVRSPGGFSAGHIPGAINVHLDGGQFQNRVGLVVPPGTELVLLADSEAGANRAARALAVIGFTAIAGFLVGGMSRWEASGRPSAATPEITVHDLNERLSDSSSTQVLDVRETHEWRAGHIDEATNLPFYQVERAAERLDPTRPVAIICGGGTRSMIAASLLQRHDFRDVVNVEGGMDAWKAAGLPTVNEPVAEPSTVS